MKEVFIKYTRHCHPVRQ